MMTTCCERLEFAIDHAVTGETLMIPMDVTYVVERDTDYGADADGQRGVTKNEVFILDTAIAKEHLQHITVNQVVELADRALTTITERPVSR
jgi:hypothetical protein